MTFHKDTQHNNDLPLCWEKLRRVSNSIFYYAECHCAECHYADCHYAEWRYAECRYAECHGTIEGSSRACQMFTKFSFSFPSVWRRCIWSPVTDLWQRSLEARCPTSSIFQTIIHCSPLHCQVNKKPIINKAAYYSCTSLYNNKLPSLIYLFVNVGYFEILKW